MIDEKKVYKIWLCCQWGSMVFIGGFVVLAFYFGVSYFVPEIPFGSLNNILFSQAVLFGIVSFVLMQLSEQIKKKYAFKYGGGIE